MSAPYLVLRLTPSGESFLKMDLLGRDEGLVFCLKRVSQKSRPTNPPPDLFDTAEIDLETSRQGTLRFVRDYHPVVRRSAIGQSYRRLQRSAGFCQLLVLNAAHLPDLPDLFDLVSRSLDAFAGPAAPDVVFLKSLFLLLKEEGFPVQESWWPTLPAALRRPAKSLINEPSPESLDEAKGQACLATLQHLQCWIRAETELILPEQVFSMV